MFLIYVVATLAGLALVVLTLPLMLELLVLSLAALGRPARSVSAGGGSLRLAVVVPAHNEEKLISTCVRSLIDQSSEGVEVYVVAHNCVDRTAEEAEAAGAQVLVLNDTVGGKGTALDHAFGHVLRAGADAVLVIDADSIVSANMTSAVRARFSAGTKALQTRYEVANAGATTKTRLAALAFMGMNVLRPRGRERLGLSAGIFGNGFALSAATLAMVPYTANSLVEDLEYHLHLIRAGVRVEFVDEATVFGEMPTNSAAASTQRARWEGGRIQMRRQWRGPLLKEVLGGRLKMLEPLLDLVALPLATEAALLGLALLPGALAHWLLFYAAAGFVVLVLYVLVAASLGPEPVETLRALASVPGYLVWKMLLIPRTRLASRAGAAWVRTKRND